MEQPLMSQEMIADLGNIQVTEGLPKVQPQAQVPVETTTTPPAETPVVEAEKTPAPAEEAPSIATTTEEVDWLSSASTKVDGQPSEKQKETVDYQKEYQALLNDPEIKLAVEARKAGKSIKDIVPNLTVTDYSKMDLKTLAEHYGKSRGWSDTDIEASIESVERKPAYEREQFMESWAQKLQSADQGKLEQFANQLREQGAQNIERERFIEQKSFQDLDAEAAFMEGKLVAGIKLTKEDSNDFKEWCKNFDITNEDGTYNLQKMRNLYLGDKKISEIQKAHYAKGKSEGVT